MRLLILLFLGTFAACTTPTTGDENDKRQATDNDAAVSGLAPGAADETSLQAPGNSETILFRGHGNEPFWNVNFYPDRIVLKEMNEPDNDLVVPLAPADRAADANVRRYRAKWEGNTLTATVSPGNCDDTMADTSYTHTLRLLVERAGQDAYELKGCGGYPSGTPLNGSWALSEINGKSVDIDDRSPTAVFNAGRINGFTGCNRFSGSFTYNNENETISFGPLGATKMACSENPYETPMLAFLGDKPLRIDRTVNELTLRNGAETMVFAYREMEE